jgi:metal-responsive CopG/Arc/MetJ family transcriptional regulator
MPPTAKPPPKLRGNRQPIPLSLPPELVAELDAIAEAGFQSRGRLIEMLLREALAARQAARVRRRTA